PYSMRIDVLPHDPGTDGVSVSFNCPSSAIGGGTGFSSSVIPAVDANLQASPSSVLFPATIVGATSAPTVITITNSGNADATGVAVSSSDNSTFKIQATTCGATIAVGASCTISVTFKPA